jgi:16S rRNA (uracil1498-N3)-methyltransferase
MSFDDFIKKKHSNNTELIVLSPQGNVNLTDLPLKHKQNIFLLIGPEAGLSDLEEEKALFSNFKPLQLGKRILRAETASVAAISAINVLTGDF